MDPRDAAMIAAAMRASQPTRQRERRGCGGCGCGNKLFWIVFVLMLPCDIAIFLAATGLLGKLGG